MLFTDIIRTKRDGGALSEAQISYLVDGLADESVPAEQVSALAMAVFLNGMSFEEAGALTLAMANSGTVLDWSADGLDGPVVDKHSTGGVGDKVSFLLAPIAAACGCYVPMISGRGLGHTGGTTDKVESIPGNTCAYDTRAAVGRGSRGRLRLLRLQQRLALRLELAGALPCALHELLGTALDQHGGPALGLTPSGTARDCGGGRDCRVWASTRVGCSGIPALQSVRRSSLP